MINEGVMVGVDRDREWLLPWWHRHYEEHNSHPIAFVDFGMSQLAKAWCRGKGSVVTLASEKSAPQALTYSPFDKTLWLELTCEVRGHLVPLFQKIHTHSGMLLGRVRLEAERADYHSAIFGVHKDSELLHKWAACSGDEGALSHLIHEEGIEVAELEDHYQWHLQWGINLEAVVTCWSGEWGLDVLKRSLSPSLF